MVAIQTTAPYERGGNAEEWRTGVNRIILDTFCPVLQSGLSRVFELLDKAQTRKNSNFVFQLPRI